MSIESRRECEVGTFIREEDDSGKVRYGYELDYGSDPWGDVDLFYRDVTQDHEGGGICYIRNVEGGVIYDDDPDFDAVAYTYDDVLRICKGYKDAADYALETAAGYGIEVIWESITDNYEDSCEEE